MRVTQQLDWTAMFEACVAKGETCYKPRTQEVHRFMLCLKHKDGIGSLADPVYGGSVLDWMLLAPWQLEYDFSGTRAKYDNIVEALAEDTDISSWHWERTILRELSRLLRPCRIWHLPQDEKNTDLVQEEKTP